MHQRVWSWSFLAVLAACGPPPPEVPELTQAPEDPGCPTVTGSFAATFTLVGTDGRCDQAKPVSHDPMDFDAAGQLRSPAEGVIDCRTAQAGCQLAVRCTSSVMSSRASLEAAVADDAESFSGLSVVAGTYKDCREVRYAVEAKRRVID